MTNETFRFRLRDVAERGKAGSQKVLDLGPHCHRCGRPLHDDREIGQMAEEALGALERMKLCVPDSVKHALRGISAEMACRLGACEERT